MIYQHQQHQHNHYLHLKGIISQHICIPYNFKQYSPPHPRPPKPQSPTPHLLHPNRKENFLYPPKRGRQSQSVNRTSSFLSVLQRVSFNQYMVPQFQGKKRIKERKGKEEVGRTYVTGSNFLSTISTKQIHLPGRV